MDWSEIVDNPYLEDLPFKIEQDRYGSVVPSPAANRPRARLGCAQQA